MLNISTSSDSNLQTTKLEKIKTKLRAGKQNHGVKFVQEILTWTRLSELKAQDKTPQASEITADVHILDKVVKGPVTRSRSKKHRSVSPVDEEIPLRTVTPKRASYRPPSPSTGHSVRRSRRISQPKIDVKKEDTDGNQERNQLKSNSATPRSRRSTRLEEDGENKKEKDPKIAAFRPKLPKIGRGFKKV